MSAAAKVRALQEACSRDPEMRRRLEASPAAVLRQNGVAVAAGAGLAALVQAILAPRELTEAELATVTGGIDSWSWGATMGDPHE